MSFLKGIGKKWGSFSPEAISGLIGNGGLFLQTYFREQGRHSFHSKTNLSKLHPVPEARQRNRQAAGGLPTGASGAHQTIGLSSLCSHCQTRDSLCLHFPKNAVKVLKGVPSGRENFFQKFSRERQNRTSKNPVSTPIKTASAGNLLFHMRIASGNSSPNTTYSMAPLANPSDKTNIIALIPPSA